MIRSCSRAILILGLTVAMPASAVQQLACADTTPVYAIQGDSHVSPLKDVTVETCGVVTAVAFSGYYLQDAAGDGDERTSDGIYVAQSGDKPTVGTELRIAGTVTERIGGGAATGNLSVTTLEDVTLIESLPAVTAPVPVVIGAAGRLPPDQSVISDDEIMVPINLQDAIDAALTPFNPATDGIDFYESLEGMLVTVADPVAVSAVRQFGRFSAEVFVLADNGQGISDDNIRTQRGGLLLAPDLDNRGDQNPERVQIQFDGTLYGSTNFPAISVGDRLGDVTGVMSYSFGNFEVAAIAPVSLSNSSVPVETTRLSPGANALVLASYNVLNLSAREQDDEQRALIASQIVNNLQQPDIIALQEIQDNNGDAGDCPRNDSSDCAGVLDASETLVALIDAIEAEGGLRYSWINVDPLVETTDDNRDNVFTFGGASLGNIRNAFLYNPARVALVEYQGLTRFTLADAGVSVPTAFDTSRDPLQAVFSFNGELVYVINNHFSSRFGSTPVFGGPQPFIQAGEQQRAAQSTAMNEWVETLLDTDANANIVVLGDLNTFEFTDELVDVLPGVRSGADPVLYNLVSTETEPAYSFIFEGNSQVLDHLFVSAALREQAEADYVHVNVDYPRLFSSTVGSDHEPVLGSLIINRAEDSPLALRAQSYSQTALEIFWERQRGADEYQVYRNGEFVKRTDGTSFFEDALQPGAAYHYQVEAYASGLLLNEDDTEIQTQPLAGQSPQGIGFLTGTVYSSSALELFWTFTPGAVPLKHIEITRNGSLVDQSRGRSFFDDGLVPGMQYHYTVTAVYTDDSQSKTVSIELKTPDPFAAPVDSPEALAVNNLRSVAYSRTAGELFWEMPLSSSAVAQFQVWRDDVLIATNRARSYFDDTLARNTSYRYVVKSLDAEGLEQAAVAVTLTTLP